MARAFGVVAIYEAISIVIEAAAAGLRCTNSAEIRGGTARIGAVNGQVAIVVRAIVANFSYA